MVDASVVVEGNEIAKTQVIGISIRVVGDSFLHTAITSKSMDTNLQGQQVMAACLQFWTLPPRVQWIKNASTVSRGVVLEGPICAAIPTVNSRPAQGCLRRSEGSTQGFHATGSNI